MQCSCGGKTKTKKENNVSYQQCEACGRNNYQDIVKKQNGRDKKFTVAVKISLSLDEVLWNE